MAIGDAPSVGVPAGAWSFPQSYVDAGFGEDNIAEFAIMAAPSKTSLNHCLLVTANANDAGHQHLANFFNAPLGESVGTQIIVFFDIYVPSGVAGGPGIYLSSGGYDNGSVRGPQMVWHASGALVAVGVNRVETTLVLSYPREVWQSVRMEIDLVSDTYHVDWAERGASLRRIGNDLQFRSGPQNALDRFTVARFSDLDIDVDAYVDNVSVTETAVVNTAPTLMLQLSGNAMIFSWPANATGFTLQSAPNLTPPVTWLDVTNPPAATDGQFTVTNPASATSQFFRLRKP